MSELIDEYIVRVYKIPSDVDRIEKNRFIEEKQKDGWDYNDEYWYEGQYLALKFSRGIGEFAND